MPGNEENAHVTVGAAIRMARLEAHLTQAQLGSRIGYSHSAVSRIESGQPVDIQTLRAIAHALEAAPERFGLAADTPSSPRAPRAPDRTAMLMRDPGKERAEVIERRGLLAGIAAAVGVAAVPQLERALFSTGAQQAPGGTVRGALKAAQADYQAARYETLGRRLPGLVGAAQQLPPAGVARDKAAALLADSLSLAAEWCSKMHDDALAWVCADRALAAAHV